MSAPADSSDIYLAVQAKRAGKVKGEATAAGHVGEIVVRSWNWGVVSAHAQGSTQAVARRAYQDLCIVKGIDSATTPLISALATNDELKEVVLSMRKPGDGQIDYFRIKLNGARVTSLRHQTEGQGVTTESVVIAFTKVEVQYTPQQAGGSGGAATTFTDEVLPS